MQFLVIFFLNHFFSTIFFLNARLENVLLHHNAIRKGLKKKLLKKNDLKKKLLKIAPKILMFAKPVWLKLDEFKKERKKILFEGAQVILLDVDHKQSKTTEDVLITNKLIKIFKNKRIKTKNTHGTGCALSSAISAFLSCGKPLVKSCELGIKYVNQAIGSNPKYGKGHGPINHLNSVNLKRKFK